MKKPGISRAGAEIVNALTEFYVTLRDGGSEAVAGHFTVCTVERTLGGIKILHGGGREEGGGDSCPEAQPDGRKD